MTHLVNFAVYVDEKHELYMELHRDLPFEYVINAASTHCGRRLKVLYIESHSQRVIKVTKDMTPSELHMCPGWTYRASVRSRRRFCCFGT